MSFDRILFAVESRDLYQADKSSIIRVSSFSILQNFNFRMIKFTVNIPKKSIAFETTYWYSVTLVWQLDIKFARLAPTFPIKLRSFLPKYLVGTFSQYLEKKTTKSTSYVWWLIFVYSNNEIRTTQNENLIVCKKLIGGSVI